MCTDPEQRSHHRLAFAGGFVRQRKRAPSLSSRDSVLTGSKVGNRETKTCCRVSEPSSRPISSSEWGKGGRPEVAIKLKC